MTVNPAGEVNSTIGTGVKQLKIIPHHSHEQSQKNVKASSIEN
jgi:hypothetical protein